MDAVAMRMTMFKRLQREEGRVAVPVTRPTERNRRRVSVAS